MLFDNNGRTGFQPVKEFKIYRRNLPRGTVWLDESFDRIVRDENELQEKLNYIINNPLKNELVEKIEDYKWLYVKGWLDKDTGKMPVPP